MARPRLLGNNRVPLVRRRYAAGSRGTDGRWVRGAVTDTPFVVSSLQELGGRDREVVEEGTRRSDYRVVYTEPGFLRTENDKVTPKLEADEVVRTDTGEVYKVVRARDFSGLLPHQKGTLFLLREGPR